MHGSIKHYIYHVHNIDHQVSLVPVILEILGQIQSRVENAEILVICKYD